MAVIQTSIAYRTLRRIKRCFDWMILPDSSAIMKSRQEKVRQRMRGMFDNVERVLDVGSGSRPISGFRKVVTMDMDPGCRVGVRADLHSMPFAASSFDLVWLGGVVEHVRDPRAAISELHRVVRQGGYVYIEMPFFQRVHGAPYDYQRFTLAGLGELCVRFEKVESGVICGPSSAFAHMTRAYLALCLSFNNRFLYRFFYYYILGWCTLPLKYLDLVVSRYRGAEEIAFAYYYAGRKT